MFYLLSKTFYILAMPITWLILLTAYGWWKRKVPRGKKSLGLALLLLLLLSNPFLQGKMMQAWEIPATPISDLPKKFSIGVVLGGVTEGFRTPNDRVYTHKGADRVLHAALLYRKGYLKKILVTGSFYKLGGQRASEAESMKQLLLLCGVAERDIIKEEESRNTRENALFSAETLQELGLENEELLLITSAFHMRRALGCFRKAGLQAKGFSTDFYSPAMPPSLPSLLLPSEEALYYNGKLVRELLGYAVYSAIGYL